MLRVTMTSIGAESVILKLEGRIVGEWVSLLQQESLASVEKGQKVLLDLSGVTYIDGPGIRLLRNMRRKKAEIVQCPPFIETLLGGGTK